MPGVLETQPPTGQLSVESSEVDVTDKNGTTTVLFNEQTNYVPKRTIITVRHTQTNKENGLTTT